jgi:hypothetical protein
MKRNLKRNFQITDSNPAVGDKESAIPHHTEEPTTRGVIQISASGKKTKIKVGEGKHKVKAVNSAPRQGSEKTSV